MCVLQSQQQLFNVELEQVHWANEKPMTLSCLVNLHAAHSPTNLVESQ